MGHYAAYSAHHRRGFERHARRALPGASPVGRARSNLFHVGAVRKQSQGQVLLVDAGRAQAARSGTRRVETFFRSGGFTPQRCISETDLTMLERIRGRIRALMHKDALERELNEEFRY